MKTPGVIGGLAPPSTELFYDIFIREVEKRVSGIVPNIIINSINLWKFIRLLQHKDEEMRFIEEEIEKIEKEVDFIALICNTVHFIVKDLRKDIKVPIMAIYQVVSNRVAESGAKRVGILGTTTTVKGNFYQLELLKHDIEAVTLDEPDQDELNSMILEKVIFNKDHPGVKSALKHFVKRLEKKGCDGVILACTELPLYLEQKDVEIKLFSSTNILAEAVAKKVFD